MPEETVGLRQEDTSRVGLQQTDTDLAEVSQGGVVVPLLMWVILHQLGRLLEALTGLGIVLLEIVVIAQIVVIDELIVSGHHRQQCLQVVKPFTAVHIVAHEGVNSTDAQHEGDAQRVAQTTLVGSLQSLQVAVGTAVIHASLAIEVGAVGHGQHPHLVDPLQSLHLVKGFFCIDDAGVGLSLNGTKPYSPGLQPFSPQTSGGSTFVVTMLLQIEGYPLALGLHRVAVHLPVPHLQRVHGGLHGTVGRGAGRTTGYDQQNADGQRKTCYQMRCHGHVCFLSACKCTKKFA